MTKQVQRRRGTSTQHTSFTGAEGEISVNTTNKSIHVHDGVTAGGVEAARADLTNVSDANLNAALSGNTLSSLTITSVDINGGTIDGAVIGGSSAAAGTFTTVTGTSFVSSGDMTFGDNDKAIFGAGSDLQIYHDGGNSFIDDVGTGRLYIRASDGIHLANPSNALYLSTYDTGNLVLYYNGAAKLATTSTGVDVTGDVGATTGTFSGDLTIADKIVHSGDTNTAIRFPAADTVTVETSGVERLRVDSAGNVGIGTTAAADYKLDVNGALTIGGTYNTSASTNGGGVNIGFDTTNGGKIESLNPGVSWYPLTVGGTEIKFTSYGSERLRIDSSGNLLIGGTTAGTASAGNLVLVNGTAPTGNVTNGITLFAEDVSSSSELKVRDEAGNVTTLSPHNFDLIPEGPSEDMAWSYYSERDGKRINVDMLKAIRLLEQISGEKLVHMV